MLRQLSVEMHASLAEAYHKYNANYDSDDVDNRVDGGNEVEEAQRLCFMLSIIGLCRNTDLELVIGQLPGASSSSSSSFSTRKHTEHSLLLFGRLLDLIELNRRTGTPGTEHDNTTGNTSNTSTSVLADDRIKGLGDHSVHNGPADAVQELDLPANLRLLEHIAQDRKHILSDECILFPSSLLLNSSEAPAPALMLQQKQALEDAIYQDQQDIAALRATGLTPSSTVPPSKSASAWKSTLEKGINDTEATASTSASTDADTNIAGSIFSSTVNDVGSSTAIHSITGSHNPNRKHHHTHMVNQGKDASEQLNRELARLTTGVYSFNDTYNGHLSPLSGRPSPSLPHKLGRKADRVMEASRHTRSLLASVSSLKHSYSQCLDGDGERDTSKGGGNSSTNDGTGANHDKGGWGDVNGIDSNGNTEASSDGVSLTSALQKLESSRMSDQAIFRLEDASQILVHSVHMKQSRKG